MTAVTQPVTIAAAQNVLTCECGAAVAAINLEMHRRSAKHQFGMRCKDFFKDDEPPPLGPRSSASSRSSVLSAPTIAIGGGGSTSTTTVAGGNVGGNSINSRLVELDPTFREPSTEMERVICPVCKCEVVGSAKWREHLRGRTHNEKLDAAFTRLVHADIPLFLWRTRVRELLENFRLQHRTRELPCRCANRVKMIQLVIRGDLADVQKVKSDLEALAADADVEMLTSADATHGEPTLVYVSPWMHHCFMDHLQPTRETTPGLFRAGAPEDSPLDTIRLKSPSTLIYFQRAPPPSPYARLVIADDEGASIRFMLQQLYDSWVYLVRQYGEDRERCELDNIVAPNWRDGIQIPDNFLRVLQQPLNTSTPGGQTDELLKEMLKNLHGPATSSH